MYHDERFNDEWNPMEEDFYSENFNSYTEGPGANLDRSLLPGFKRRSNIQKPLCKLYVHKIPPNLTEGGLGNVFKTFGNPLSIFLSPKPNGTDNFWAFVVYATISEGQAAIDALNGRSPLYLGVQFARSEEHKERIRQENEQSRFYRQMFSSEDYSEELPEMVSPYPSITFYYKFTEQQFYYKFTDNNEIRRERATTAFDNRVAIGRGRGIPFVTPHTAREICPGSSGSMTSYALNNYAASEMDEILFKKRIPPGVYTEYQGSMWDPSNARVMDNVYLTVNSTQEGRRISLGRATSSQSGEIRPRFKRNIFKLNHCEKDKNDNPVGLCVFCDEPSKYACGRCGTWYCSSECQLKDWSVHKTKCSIFSGQTKNLKESEDDTSQHSGRSGRQTQQEMECPQEKKAYKSSALDNSQQRSPLAKGNSQSKQTNRLSMENGEGDDDWESVITTSSGNKLQSFKAGDDQQKFQGFKQKGKDGEERKFERRGGNCERKDVSQHNAGRRAYNNDEDCQGKEEEEIGKRGNVLRTSQGFNSRDKDRRSTEGKGSSFVSGCKERDDSWDHERGEGQNREKGGNWQRETGGDRKGEQGKGSLMNTGRRRVDEDEEAWDKDAKESRGGSNYKPRDYNQRGKNAEERGFQDKSREYEGNEGKRKDEGESFNSEKYGNGWEDGKGGNRGRGDRVGDRGRGNGDRGRWNGDRGGDRGRGNGDRGRGNGDRGGDRGRGNGDRGGDRGRGNGDRGRGDRGWGDRRDDFGNERGEIQGGGGDRGRGTGGHRGRGERVERGRGEGNYNRRDGFGSERGRGGDFGGGKGRDFRGNGRGWDYSKQREDFGSRSQVKANDPPSGNVEEDDWDAEKPVPVPSLNIPDSSLKIQETKSPLNNSAVCIRRVHLPGDKNEEPVPVPSPTLPDSDLKTQETKLPLNNSCIYNQCVQLPTERFAEVTVTSKLQSGNYWVQPKEEQNDLLAIMSLMNRNWTPPEKPFETKVGDICTALFEHFPYRGRVVSLGQRNARVFFIDFGNTDVCELINMDELPSDVKKYKSQAIEISLAEGTPKEYMDLPENSILKVKPVGKNEGGATIVEVEGVDYKKACDIPSREESALVDLKKNIAPDVQEKVSQSSTQANDCKMIGWPSSVLNTLEEGKTAVCEVCSVENKDELGDSAIVVIISDGNLDKIIDIFEKLPKECKGLPFDPSFRPSVGELVTVFNDETWYRAIVLDEGADGWLVALCDSGVVMESKKLKKLPNNQRYRDAPAIAAKCQIVKSLVPRNELFSEKKMKVGSKLNIKVGRRIGDQVEAELHSHLESTFCKIKLEVWKPEKSKPKCVILNNGDLVKIMTFFNPAALYVQPVDKEIQNKIERLHQDVSGACMPIRGNKEMEQVPSIGSVVGSKYVDGNYYRALVTDVKSSQEISVSYLEFGNREVVTLEKLRDLPKELKQVPAYAVKIGLKTSQSAQLNREAASLVNELMVNNTELIFKCPDEDLRCSELFMKNGKSLAEKLNELMEPEWKKSTKREDQLFTMSSFQTMKLPGSSPSEEPKATPLLVLNCPGKCAVVACLAEHSLMKDVYEHLITEMTEYCNKSPAEPYVPRATEICLAKYTDGMWYRALSMKADKEASTIYFVDFGNWCTVQHRDIRKMVPCFMEKPLLANICTYKGFEDETMTVEQETRLKELLKPNSIFITRIWSSSDDEYIIDIPEVTEKLIEEKLLP